MIMKPMLLENNNIQPCLGISKAVSNEQLFDILDDNAYYETMTNGGGIFGSDINIFTLMDGRMIHSQILNDYDL